MNLPASEAIILAGGRGTRLSPVVPDRPKALAPIAGKAFLEHQIALLARIGAAERAVLALGHMSEQIIEYFRGITAPLEIDFVIEERPLGTGGALRLALEQCARARVLGLNGDSLFAFDPRRLAAVHGTAGAGVTLALARVGDTSRYGRVELDGGGRIQRFVEKADAAGPGLINAGVYLIERGALETRAAGDAFSFENDFLPPLVKAGAVAGAVFDTPFIDIGVPESYAEAEAFLAGLSS